MFIEQQKPKDYDCGYNLDLMIAAIPRVPEGEERQAYAKRVVGLIKQSHPNWVSDDGTSRAAWDYLFELADIDLDALGIKNPFLSGEADDAE
ncbi:MAG TPA: DUF4290 domain-containing protein [Balneolaceae bacterium]|nr:DUF4290 domain-containing protein [Balneolaceae bacterium]|tara:strand:+ start:103428 stop:103703 length:276 start_codon:yes stop_codon:yes gene_type:complete